MLQSLRHKGFVGTTSEMPPASSAVVFWNTTTDTWWYSNGSTWTELVGGTGGMAQHSNEYHTPDMALADHNHSGTYEPASSAIQTHITGTGSPHTAAGVGAEAAGAVSTHNGLTGPHASATSIGGKAIPGAGFEPAGTAAGEVLAHSGAADPHSGYQKESEKAAANGYASLDSNTLVPVAQLGTGTPTGAKYLRDDRTWQTPAGGSTPAWHGALYGAFGGCNPNDMLQLMLNNPVHATPTNIGVSVGRCAYFRPPANITVQRIRFFGVGATTGVYHVAIYATPAGGARLTADLSPNTAAQTWGDCGSGLGLALTAGTLYAICVGIDTVGTTAGMHCMSSTTGRIGVLPASWPGNLDVDLASPIIDPCAFFQVALSTGAMPATLPAITAQAAWTGGMPAIFLDANNA